MKTIDGITYRCCGIEGQESAYDVEVQEKAEGVARGRWTKIGEVCKFGSRWYNDAEGKESEPFGSKGAALSDLLAKWKHPAVVVVAPPEGGAEHERDRPAGHAQPRRAEALAPLPEPIPLCFAKHVRHTAGYSGGVIVEIARTLDGVRVTAEFDGGKIVLRGGLEDFRNEE